MATRRYFQSLEKWTSDRDDAFDFGLISKAMRAAQKLRIADLELVLSFDGSDHATATSFERFLFGLSRSKNRQVRANGRLVCSEPS